MNGHILLAVLLGVIPLAAAIVIARRMTSKLPNPGNPEAVARLVLTEISLYDRKAADQAWSQAAVYRLLKSDIDRARDMFLARFPEAEDVFYRMLVAVLARGDADRIGTDYPYARTELSTGQSRTEPWEHAAPN